MINLAPFDDLRADTIEARHNWLQSIKDNYGMIDAHPLISARWQRFVDLVHTMGWDITQFETYLSKYDPTEYAFGDTVRDAWRYE